MYIGLRFYPETGVTAWDDGTSTASDTPWRGNIIVGATLAVIRVQGELKLTTGENGRFALCGNRKISEIMIINIMKTFRSLWKP